VELVVKVWSSWLVPGPLVVDGRDCWCKSGYYQLGPFQVYFTQCKTMTELAKIIIHMQPR